MLLLGAVLIALHSRSSSSFYLPHGRSLGPTLLLLPICSSIGSMGGGVGVGHCCIVCPGVIMNRGDGL